jgi:hypothetical protein
MDNLNKIRTDKQISNDKRLSDFFKNYHCKIKELKLTEDKNIDKKIVIKEKKRKGRPKKICDPIVVIEEIKSIINI